MPSRESGILSLILSEVDEYLAEEFRIVAAHLIIGQIFGCALIFQDEEFGELLSFGTVQGSDKRIEAPAVIEIVIRRGACARRG